MKKYILIPFLLALLLTSLCAQESLITNAYHRTSKSLNGEWKYIIDPYENGFYNYRYEPFDNQENPWRDAFFTNTKPTKKTDLIEYDFDRSDSMQVPGDWNTQEEKLLYYEGTIWLKKSFDYVLSQKSNRVFVYFEAVNYEADVYLNGKKLGKHIGGFTPFNFEVTGLLKTKDNFLIVKVDNKRKKEAVPTLNTDWWNYGGITRGVKLIETPANFIQQYTIQLDKTNTERIQAFVALNGSERGQKEVTIIIPELGIRRTATTDAEGQLKVGLYAKDIQYWSLENPHLYKVIIQTDQEKVVDQIGFRTIETDGPDILLNGKSIFLKGISIHEESPIRGGRGHSEADARQLLTWARELGCNYVRLAHYAHNEHMVRLADQMGILVWEENPVYWTIDWENEATFLNAKNQLTELISRDQNRASVIIWSMANETPNSDARNRFLTRLAKHARELDPSRLISAALEQHDLEGSKDVRTIDDPFADVVDILSFNQYIGWYDGLPEKCSRISWRITQNKPVIISEFGAGAKHGLHGDQDTRWTEEFQEHLYVETLRMLSNIENLRGISPWILVDFRSPRRVLPGIQDGWNRKGLIAEDGQKKKAFFVLKRFYDGKKE
ncbi:MAG: glycoside hydrolase family 2 protein [Bacteroidia bacterium]